MTLVFIAVPEPDVAPVFFFLMLWMLHHWLSHGARRRRWKCDLRTPQKGGRP